MDAIKNLSELQDQVDQTIVSQNAIVNNHQLSQSPKSIKSRSNERRANEDVERGLTKNYSIPPQIFHDHNEPTVMASSEYCDPPRKGRKTRPYSAKVNLNHQVQNVSSNVTNSRHLADLQSIYSSNQSQTMLKNISKRPLSGKQMSLHHQSVSSFHTNKIRSKERVHGMVHKSPYNQRFVRHKRDPTNEFVTKSMQSFAPRDRQRNLAS